MPPAKARYLVRGYLTATPIEGGAEVDLVWDVFTPDKRRAQRLSDAIAVRGAGDDAWAMIGDAGLDSVAAKSADDLAAYLSNTPEAAPAGRRAQLRPIGLFLVDIPPASGRRKQNVMLFRGGAAAMTRRVRAVKRASGAGLENRPCSAR